MSSRGRLKPDDYRVVQEQYTYLMEQIDAKNLVDYLFSRGFLDEDDKEKICHHCKCRSERNEVLLRRLLDSGPGNNYQIFLESLKMKNQYIHVYDHLISNSAQATVEIASNGGNTAVEVDESNRHIMISYCHADTDLVHKIYRSLQSKGYKIWIDTKDMPGNLLDGMSEGVQNAWLVLLCISEKYYNSKNCRKEAENAHGSKEYMILKVQQGYQPQDWLKFIVGQKLYIDFGGSSSDTTRFDDLMESLVHQIEIVRNGPVA